MKHLTMKTGKTGLLLSAAALFAFLLTTPATAGFGQNADTGQLLGRINQLENQLQTLSRAVYRGKVPEGAAIPAGTDSGAMASFEVRLSQIENQQRSMVGQIERLNYEIQQMKTKLDKTLSDNEMRFQQMERGTTSGSNSTITTGRNDAVMQGDLYADSGATSSGNSGGRTLGTISNNGSDPANMLYESAFSDIRESKYDAAEDKFRRFMSMYPSHALAANAQYWLAETYYVRGDYAQSARMFAQGYQDYPKGAKAADSLLKLGLSLSQLGKKEDACLSYQQLKKEFPGNQSAVIRRADQEIKRLGCK